jgi:hypothetical protein
MKDTFLEINNRFRNNLLSLDLEKTQWLQFSTIKNISTGFQIGDKDKYIVRTSSIKFLGLIINDTLTWKRHIDYITRKLNAACFAIKTVNSLLSREALKIIYFAYVIFWGNSVHSIKIFRIQKKIIRIMGKLRSRDSCRNTFKTIKILPFYSQYIFSILIYIINNRHLFITNQEVRNVNTRSNLKFHVPGSNLAKFQKGLYYSGIKLFNHLPSSIRSLANDTKLFRTTLKKKFYSNSFYTIEEYCNFQKD